MARQRRIQQVLERRRVHAIISRRRYPPNENFLELATGSGGDNDRRIQPSLVEESLLNPARHGS